jgi:hypothetical protein
MSGNAVQVTWSTLPLAVAYTLERSEDSINFQSIASGLTSPDYSDSGITSGQAYFYRYRIEYSGGFVGAPSANSLPVTPGNPLLTPANLTAKASDVAQVSLSWVQSPNTVSYNVYRGGVSGGPYVFKANVPVTETAYVDNTVIPGAAYYYVVTAVNNSGVNSAYSNEAGVDFTVTVPSGLAANPTNGSIALSWNPSGGASQYYLYRSLEENGSYSLIYSGVTASFNDPDIRHATDYYYKVAARFTGGGTSHTSAAVLATGIATLDLTVPIELTDQPLASDQTDVVFDRTQTSFDPDDYDGTKSYFLEAVVTNQDDQSRSVLWVDQGGADYADLSVPAGTTAPTLIRVPLNSVPTAGIYRLKLEASTFLGQVQVLTARLLVKQTGATFTKLYFPLLSKPAVPTSSDALSPAHTTSSVAYEALSIANRYTRNTADQSTLEEFNTWELEAVVAAQQDAIGSVALRNVQRDALVEDSQTFFRGQTLALANVPISEGLENFSSSNEGEQYDVVARCDVNCTSEVQLYKAGLWLNVRDLSKVEVVQRLTLGASYPDGLPVLADARASVNLTDFSNPTFGFRVTGSTPLMSMMDVHLANAGTSDSSTSGMSQVSGSLLSFGLPDLMTQSTPMNLSIADGSRVVVEVNAPAGAQVRGAELVIRGHR